MNLIEFDWTYLTGFKMAHSAVKKYRERTIGIIKEELFKSINALPETLYYVPGDEFTFTNEEKFISRIDTLLKKEHLFRNTPFPDAPVIQLGTFHFEKDRFVFDLQETLVREKEHFYTFQNGRNEGDQACSISETINNHVILHNYRINGKLVFRY